MDWRFCGDKARSKKSRHTRDGEILRLLHNWTSRKDCTLIVCSEGRAMKVGPRALRKTFSRPQTAKIQSWPCKNIDRGISLRGFLLSGSPTKAEGENLTTRFVPSQKVSKREVWPWWEPEGRSHRRPLGEGLHSRRQPCPRVSFPSQLPVLAYTLGLPSPPRPFRI